VIAFVTIIKNYGEGRTKKEGEEGEEYALRPVMSLFKLCLVLWMVFNITEQALFYSAIPPKYKKSIDGGLLLTGYPTKAGDFLVNQNINGNFFNDFNSGAYLLGRKFPEIKVFIDGRTEVYGMEFYQYYKRIWKGDWFLFQEAVEKYDLSGVFLTSVYKPLPMQIISHLLKSPEWVLVYFGDDAVIFLKRTDQHLPVIERFAITNAKVGKYPN